MKSFVTGGAGFIGSHLVDRLIQRGDEVVAWDNFSTGNIQFLERAVSNPRLRIVRGNNLHLPELIKAMSNCDQVFHLAANADVRFGLQHPSQDLEQNTIATFNVLEAMRVNGIRTLAFASTGSVYGEAEVIPTPEDAPFPTQTSLYGASKLAGEGLIQAYCEGFGFQGYIFRFVSVLGERYSHGHVFDFYKQLLENPDRLCVLGDGTQRKSYIYVQDCLSAILHVMESKSFTAGSQVYNLGTTEYCHLTDSVSWICDFLGLRPKLEFSGGNRGWVGDNPFIFLDTAKIQATGWRAALSVQEGIVRTIRWLTENPWILQRA
jgi:UDP-glucose 4-epimerase